MTAPRSLQRGTRTALCLLVTSVLSVAPVSAHNTGFTALALPVDSIHVDGDLSDWPGAAPAYPLGAVLKGYSNYDGDDPDPDDLTAWFHVAWSPDRQRLYVAVVAVDDTTVLGNTPQSTDAIEIYLDGRHTTDTPSQYLMFPGDATYRLFGTATNPTLSGGDAKAAGANGMHRAVGDTNVYEMSLRPFGESATEPTPLEPAQRLAFDAVVVDMDPGAGGATWLSWSPQGGKVASGSRVGDVWLMDSPTGLHAMGRVQGRIAGHGDAPWRGLVVRLRDGEGRSWATDITTAEGRFGLWGPPGEVVLDVDDVEPPVQRAFALSAGDVKQLDLTVYGRHANRLPVWPLGIAGFLISAAALGALVPLRGRYEALGGVLIGPAATFQRLSQRPDWTAPAALVLFCATIASVAGVNQAPGQLWGALMGISGTLTAVLLVSVPILLTIFLVVLLFGSWAVFGALLWGVGSIAGGKGRFFHVLSGAGYANVPAALGVCVASLTVAFGGPGEAMLSGYTGLGSLVSDPVWQAALQRVELFSLWSWVLGGLALIPTMGLSRGRALMAAGVGWLVATACVIGFTAVMQSVSAALAEAAR